jgi:flagellar motor protein MotB
MIGLAGLIWQMPVTLAQPPEGQSPIYRVTVVERTIKAINYEYQNGPTMIDFRGTVLLPHSKGEAMVESRRGRTQIDAKLEGLSTPQHFGREYLSYVLWAITPEGRPHNIGEVVPGPSDKAKIHVTTDLQAFALIVTAEPYAAVRQPSDVVVLENEVRPDTAGIAEPVMAKYELLPRGEYTWHVSRELDRAVANAPKVSMHDYEAIVQLYQAENAVGIARAANAERYAPGTFTRAEQLLATARRLRDDRADYREVVRTAREASQTAEDSRLIAQRLQQAEKLHVADTALSRTQAELVSARQAKEEAIEAAQQAQAEAAAAREQVKAPTVPAPAGSYPAVRDRAYTQAPIPPPNNSAAGEQQVRPDGRKREVRVQMLEELNGVLPTLDTPRGLVAKVADDGFRGLDFLSTTSEELAQFARIVSRRPDLRVAVEGYCDSAGKESLARERAENVRRALIANGISSGVVSAVGLGNSRPIGPNSSEEARRENSRVEIVISGNSIGEMPSWDRSYSLTRQTVPTATLP